MNNQEIYEIATKIHKHFVDTMKDKLESSVTEYSSIRVLPLLGGGGISKDIPPELWVCDCHENEQDIISTVAHESTHCLHNKIREIYQTGGEKAIDENYWLIETVAHLGSLVYLEANANPLTMQEYIQDTRDVEELADALKIFRTDKTLLGKLANMNMKDAKSLIEKL